MKQLPNFSNYWISSDGKLFTENWKNTGKFREMKPAKDGNGYLRTVMVDDSGKNNTVKIHRIVAQAYLSNPENKEQVNHKNSIKTDNSVDNLEWCTFDENIAHRELTNPQKAFKGSENGFAKLNEEQVKEILTYYEANKPYYGRADLAKRYKVAEGTIKDVVQRRRWKHVSI